MNVHPSVSKLWEAYLYSIGEEIPSTTLSYSIDLFGDTREIASEALYLVLTGQKTATAPSLWELEAAGIKIPEPGDLTIITDWNRHAQCIIRTKSVSVVPFNKVTAAFARLEGEGDGSLDYWRNQHWAYYLRVLKDSDKRPSETMPIVCEEFEMVYPEF